MEKEKKELTKRDIGVFFLALVLLIIAAMIGSAVYYTQSFGNLTSTLSHTEYNLSYTSTELESYKLQLTDALERLNDSKRDLDYYDRLYLNKTNELDNTKTTLTSQILELTKDLNKTTKELRSTLEVLNQTNYNLTWTYNAYLNFKDKYEKADKDRTELKDEVEYLKDRLKTYETT
jgi:chromosome segregation ATPase